MMHLKNKKGFLNNNNRYTQGVIIKWCIQFKIYFFIFIFIFIFISLFTFGIIKVSQSN